MSLETNVICEQILEKVANLDNSITILTNAFVIFFGVLVAILVCYLMYKLVSNFINY